MTKKAALSTQTFFYIFMAIVFIAILFYGFQKIFDLQEQVPEQERIILKNDLHNALDYCSVPLNKGSVKTIKFTSSSFNTVCLISRSN